MAKNTESGFDLLSYGTNQTQTEMMVICFLSFEIYIIFRNKYRGHGDDVRHISG